MENTEPKLTNFKVSDAAFEKIKDLLAEENNSELALRIFVQGGGCSGFQYGFTFDQPTDDDLNLILKEGVRIVTDPMSLQYIQTAEIDYQEDLRGSSFQVKNPAATSTCGCGSSFSTN